MMKTKTSLDESGDVPLTLTNKIKILHHKMMKETGRDCGVRCKSTRSDENNEQINKKKTTRGKEGKKLLQIIKRVL